MKVICRLGLILLPLFLTPHLFGQNWPGYETGRFSGVSSANERPGGMAPNPYKVDITLAGIHLLSQTRNLFANNDALGEISSGGLEGLSAFRQLSANRTSIYSNIQGPSALVSVTPKLALAFTWNMRFLWSSSLSDPQLAHLFSDDNSTLHLNGSGESATTLFNSWNEFGLGAGGVVFKKYHHSLSIGGFVKLVSGTGNLNFQLDNIDVQTTDSTVEHIGLNIKALISKQTYELVDEGKLKLFDQMGFGFDLGAEYKFENPRSCPGVSNYLLKVGFSLTDIGKTKYQSALEYTNISVSADDISLERLRGATTLRAAVDTLQEIFDIDTSGSGSGYNVTLPMSLRVYGDYNFGNRFCIFTEFHFIFAKFMAEAAETPVIFKYNITPRFEDWRYGVYLPITFTNYVPANVGLALRWKAFILGSANLFTFWVYDQYGKPLDVYLTIKIPVLKQEERIDYSVHKSKRL